MSTVSMYGKRITFRLKEEEACTITLGQLPRIFQLAGCAYRPTHHITEPSGSKYGKRPRVVTWMARSRQSSKNLSVRPPILLTLSKKEHVRRSWSASAGRPSTRNGSRKRQSVEGCRRSRRAKRELRQIIAGWVESNHIERFLQDIEIKAASLSEGEKVEVLERLRIVRELLVSTDALDHFKKWRSPDER